MPNTIQQNLNRLTNVKTDIADAIISAGGTVNVGDGLEEFADDINNRFNEVNSTIEGLLAAPQIRDVTIDFINETQEFTGISADKLSVYKNITRCNVADDGTINAYYGDNSYTEDGTNGQVMVKIPKFYYKVNHTLSSNNINVGNWSITNELRDGYTVHPAFKNANNREIDYFLIGAFELCFDPYNSNKGASIGRQDIIYQWSNRGQLRNYCTRRGNNWYLLGIRQWSAIQMLFLVEYGCNAQSSVGLGVVNMSSGYSPAICGYTVGNTTGNADSTVYGDGRTYTTNGYVSVNYRGIENLWGNCWFPVEGITAGTDYKLYINNTYNFSDSATGTALSIRPGTGYSGGGYIKKFGYSPTYKWLFIPNTVDSTYNNLFGGDRGSWGTDASTTYIPSYGGNDTSGNVAGMFTMGVYTKSNESYPNFTGRLMYIPS